MSFSQDIAERLLNGPAPLWCHDEWPMPEFSRSSGLKVVARQLGVMRLWELQFAILADGEIPATCPFGQRGNGKCPRGARHRCLRPKPFGYAGLSEDRAVLSGQLHNGCDKLRQFFVEAAFEELKEKAI